MNKTKIYLIGLIFLFFVPLTINAKSIQCMDQALQVTLNPGETETYRLVGTLCSKGNPNGKTLQILIHGATYSRVYWDFGFRPNHYSYSRQAVKEGYATFSMDRLGAGESDHPDGNLVDLYSDVHVMHQVIHALRSGEGEIIWHHHPVSFDKITVVGHSLGSFVALALAGTYPDDVDGVVLTGFIHDINFDSLANLINSFYPATLDPLFTGQFPNNDYLTTIPETRESLFYYSPKVMSQVLVHDEATKATIPVGELSSVETILTGPFSYLVEDPVLVAVGEYDSLFCGNMVDCTDSQAVQDYESEFYGPAACLETTVIPNSGHDINLHKNAPRAYNRIIRWINRRVGRRANHSPRDPCVVE